MNRVEEFRAQYRQQQIGPRYSGALHLAFTSLGCLALMVFCALQLREVQAQQWLVVPLTLLYANFSEWAGHRGPMHKRRPGLGLIYERHTQQHHRFFTPQQMSFDSRRDYKAVLFPPVLLIFFVLAFALPVGLAIAWLFSANSAWLFVLCSVGYFLNYEWLHYAWHVPPGHWIARLPGYAGLQEHHRLHHAPQRMRLANFNISYPIADRIMGTYDHRPLTTETEPPA